MIISIRSIITKCNQVMMIIIGQKDNQENDAITIISIHIISLIIIVIVIVNLIVVIVIINSLIPILISLIAINCHFDFSHCHDFCHFPLSHCHHQN